MSGTVWCQYSWDLSSMAPQAALNWIAEIICFNLLQGYLLIRTTSAAEHNWSTDELWWGGGVVSGEGFLRLLFHMLLKVP